MPFPERATVPDRSKQVSAEKYIDALSSQFDNKHKDSLRAKLSAKTKGGKITTPDRLKQLQLLETTYNKLVEEQTRPEDPEATKRTLTDMLRTMVGALLFVQMDIEESYYRDNLAYYSGYKAEGSRLYELINESSVVQACLNPKTSQVRGLAQEELTTKTLSIREDNMLSALHAFSTFYMDNTFDERRNLDGTVELLPKVTNIFNDAFLAEGYKEDKLPEPQDRFLRQLKRFQLTKDMTEEQKHDLVETNSKYVKDPKAYTSMRQQVLSDMFKPSEAEKKATKEGKKDKTASTGWLGFWGTKKTEEKPEDPASSPLKGATVV